MASLMESRLADARPGPARSRGHAANYAPSARSGACIRGLQSIAKAVAAR